MTPQFNIGDEVFVINHKGKVLGEAVVVDLMFYKKGIHRMLITPHGTYGVECVIDHYGYKVDPDPIPVIENPLGAYGAEHLRLKPKGSGVTLSQFMAKLKNKKLECA